VCAHQSGDAKSKEERARRREQEGESKEERAKLTEGDVCGAGYGLVSRFLRCTGITRQHPGH